MQYVNFGTTGLQISRLGFGGIPIQRIDQPGTRELLIAAHKAGINYIDTARAYTVSEAWIGQSLEEAGLRDDFILATKCRALTKADMEAEIATSLKNLRTDHIELFQFHNPSLDGLKTILAPGGAMEALLEAKARGIVGHIGITAHLAAVFKAALDIPEIETIMFPYNIVEQQGRELIDRCAAAGKGFIDMKPLAGGAIEDGRLALRYVLSNPAVTVSIPRHGDGGGAERQRGGRGQHRPAHARRGGRLPEGARRAGHPVLPPLQLLCALHGGDFHPQCVPVPGVPEPLRPAAVGPRALCDAADQGRCLHPVRCL